MNSLVGKKILVPVDLSEASDAALLYAIKLSSASEQITALHVAIPFTAVEPPYMYLIDESGRRSQLEEAVVKHFAREQFRGIRVEVRYGDPGHQIAEFAREMEAALIVMPSHGRTGLAHLLVGSVAERVVRFAPCPVLVLRGLKSGQAMLA